MGFFSSLIYVCPILDNLDVEDIILYPSRNPPQTKGHKTMANICLPLKGGELIADHIGSSTSD